ncbi:HU family DNA-binding protein [Cetobacterium sp. 2G large]|uniref:HU family DNA-binding protein n=1 Tax=Cetobacterium sp. 2G large TaxID=2759680 RepID=UPI00163B75CD|nr:HU family DNA-binding protein [Cetobacterium sp. 2G large]MBC2854709.1 HU family DNA-binding protein [Cetobacterium sp. 2G large]
MTKQEFVALYQEKMEITTKKEAERLVNGFFSTIEEVLVNGDDLSVLGFGKFETTTQSARTCRNPKTGEEIKVPEKKVVKFRVGKGLAEKVAK